MPNLKSPHYLILFLCLTCVLACNYISLNFLQEAQNFEDVTVYDGTGEHTWAFNHGEQICKTQDEMSFVWGDRGDEIISIGKCMSIKGLNPYTCYELHPGDTCRVIIKGNFNGDTFIPESCSGDHPVSGEANNKKSVLKGTIKCGDDTFVVSIPLTKKK